MLLKSHASHGESGAAAGSHERASSELFIRSMEFWKLQPVWFAPVRVICGWALVNTRCPMQNAQWGSAVNVQLIRAPPLYVPFPGIVSLPA